MLRRIRQIMHAEAIAILPASASVYAAAAMMKRQRQSGVLVMTKECLEGILTEQDVVRRVVAEQRDPSKVTLADVMTGNPDTITPDDLALTGLQMMENGCYRHLPVIEKGRVIGLISRVDFPGEEKTELEAERHCWERLG
jgi:signal-transduction protein with cAMP-binding, CBS, and nucleotidyltransferase domain